MTQQELAKIIRGDIKVYCPALSEVQVDDLQHDIMISVRLHVKAQLDEAKNAVEATIAEYDIE